MNEKMYAFWKYDTPPYLLGGEVEGIKEDGYVTIVGRTGYEFKPVLIVPLEKGIKLQKKINKANAKYRKTVDTAKRELLDVVTEISR